MNVEHDCNIRRQTFHRQALESSLKHYWRRKSMIPIRNTVAVYSFIENPVLWVRSEITGSAISRIC